MFIVYSAGIGFELVSCHHSTAAHQANQSFNPLIIYHIWGSHFLAYKKFQDVLGSNSFSRTFQVLEILEKNPGLSGGVGTLYNTHQQNYQHCHGSRVNEP